VATFRQLRRPSDLDATLVVPEDGFGDVFLVIDGWTTLRSDYEDLEPMLADIATRGLSYGIHLVTTATRWSDFRHTIKDLFGSRLELKLGDPSDSMVNRKAAANVPAGQPGRGLVAEDLHMLTALPQTIGHTATSLVSGIAAGWSGEPARPVRMLPALLPYAAVLEIGESGEPVPIGRGMSLPLGIAEADLRPVLVDFATDPHLVAFGDSECGKSSLLRSLAESITRRYAPEQARIVLIDYRRSLLGAVATDHLIGYGTAAENTVPLIASVASYMDKRRPGPDVTPEQLRARSWWTGPECFVLVDDYDLIATGPPNPLLPLLEYLSQARDVGLHLVLTRRAGGAGRSMYEPILQRLRELGSPGLVMSGERDEGPLVGTVRPSLQPPGRGWLVTRKEGARLVQLAHVPGLAPPK
jgi:S-DNA-T family DNA segregation ATPase FtsK/SpoIIIE